MTRILLSVRCLLWEAIVHEREGDAPCTPPILHWETAVQSVPSVEDWLPVRRTPGTNFACDFHQAILKEDRDRVDSTAQQALLTGLDSYQQDYRVVLADGRFVWLQEAVLIETLGGRNWKLAGLVTDITERKTSDVAHAKALENAHCILWYAWIDQVGPDEFHWDIHLLNETAARNWLPVAPSSDGKYTTALYNATLRDDRQAGDALSAKILQSGQDSYTQDRRVQTAMGDIRWIREEVALTAVGENRWYAAGVMVDVTAQKDAEQVLSYQASHDSLTGLYNRNHFMGELTSLLTHSEQEARSASSLFFIDLDNFKSINDCFGHIMGDRVLATLAQRLQQEIGEIGVISRIGGDEFTIFLPGFSGKDEAAELAEKLLTSIHLPFSLDQQVFVLSASIGIAEGTMEFPQDLLGKANTAMLYAKRKGKASYQFFTPSMEEASLQRFERETELHHAVQEQVLVPYYQPIVSLKSRKIVGIEALARWPLPEGKFCPPSEFIPLAEETGMIVPLSKALLRRICLEGRCWLTQISDIPLRIHYNVSERLFQEPNAFLHLQKLLLETGFPPTALTLELTESILLEDSEHTRLRLEALHELGIKLVLDDFGTGYSSLAYLTRLPVNAIKIDQSFVRPLESPNPRVVHQNQAIIRAIVALGRALELEVTAEGIETERQLTYLRGQGVHYGQGYLFSRPMPAEAFSQYLKNQSAKA